MNRQQKAVRAIRTLNSSIESSIRLYHKLSKLGKGWQVGFYGFNHPRLAELEKSAYKAMLMAYKGNNLYYKRQLRLAALGISDGGKPPLWKV